MLWRLLRAPVLIGSGALLGFLLPYMIALDHQVRERFDGLSWQIPSRVFARPLELTRGQPLNAESLLLELDAARYRADEDARSPGTYARNGNRFVIGRRACVGLDGAHPALRLSLELANGRVANLTDTANGKAVPSAEVDPARIATLYGSQQEERRIVQLEQVPALLIAGLQAVEDREFKHHHGVDITAILRAGWANLSAGRVVQGGSTLTQQLVKNLFLDRGQSFVRKANEALISLLIEFRSTSAAS